MRSLRLKLIFTLLIISVSGTLITTVIVRLSSTQAFDDLLRAQNQAEFISDLLTFYEDNGSWLGVQQIVSEGILPTAAGQPPVNPSPFALADEDGRIIIPNGQNIPNSIASSTALTDGVPLEVDGVRVGTVLTDDQPPPRNPAESTFVSQTNRALIIGSLGATLVAVILAILMARTLTKPLQELSQASRKMAQGELQQTVPVRTQDELGELATAFNQMSAELEQVNQARRQMTADIAHDLRSPLTVLSGYLEAMEDGTLAPTPARLALMQQEVQSLQRLVTDLRTLSLADTGHLTLHKEPTDIADLLTHVQNTFIQQATRQEITLSGTTDEAVHTVSLDAARIRQVLGNLLGNALRYTPPNGTITLSAEPLADGGVQIKVSNTGAGIPEADLPHIFDRFYRGDRSRQDGQSGLGLAIAKSLILAHNGTISAASTPDVETTFTISLPNSFIPA